MRLTRSTRRSTDARHGLVLPIVKRSPWRVLLVAAALHISAGTVAARPGVLSREARTAKFLYEFALFIEWPPHAFVDAHDPIVVGVVGNDKLTDIFERDFQGKRIKGRPLLVRQLPWGTELRGCHLLFVPATEAARMQELPALLEDAPVVSLSDDQAAARNGSVVSFAVRDNRVRLEINVDRARMARIGISSRVLRLARIRRGGDL
jgi:hypothetical protein